MVIIDSGEQHLLRVLVGNVLDHQGGTRFASISNALNVKNVLALVLTLLDRLQITMVVLRKWRNRVSKYPRARVCVRVKK